MTLNCPPEFQRRAQCVSEDGTDHGTAKLIPQVGGHERGHGDGDEEEAADDNHSTTNDGGTELRRGLALATGSLTPKRLAKSRLDRVAVSRLSPVLRGRFVYMLYNGGRSAK